jgi:hypothetical protein
MLLKKGASWGLTLHDIGSLLCKDHDQKNSAMESMLLCAMDSSPDVTDPAFFQILGEVIDKRLSQFNAGYSPVSLC